MKTYELFDALDETNEACCLKGILLHRTAWLDKDGYLICQYDKSKFNLSKEILDCDWEIFKR